MRVVEFSKTTFPWLASCKPKRLSSFPLVFLSSIQLSAFPSHSQSFLGLVRISFNLMLLASRGFPAVGVGGRLLMGQGVAARAAVAWLSAEKKSSALPASIIRRMALIAQASRARAGGGKVEA